MKTNRVLLVYRMEYYLLYTTVNSINENILGYIMLDVYRISVVTLMVKNMEQSCNFYSQIPGFKLA